MKWQPIESAPKEELVKYLICFGSGHVEIGEFIARKPNDDREGNGWCVWHGDVSATHWMPLPKPPSKRAKIF